jgi:hypothetical protein
LLPPRDVPVTEPSARLTAWSGSGNVRDVISVQQTSGSPEGLALIGAVLVGASIAGAVLCQRLRVV